MKSYVLAGASSRALYMFAKPLREELGDFARLKGVYDINPGRAEILGKECGIPAYQSFEAMLEETGPDMVIVTTVDAFHHEYIIKALESGCDVISEKPMTIDAEKCRAVLETERRTGRKVTVTFNYRYIPLMTKIKELICNGTVGDIYSVDFEWLLDRNMDINAHGTSYFRRWNRYMKKSGGLLVHKATHHFDLVNWWIREQPREVAAFGKLNRYGGNGDLRGERCLTCLHKSHCEFYYDITKNPFEMRYYVEVEKYDGYHKDACVFSEDIDIYDTMSVNVLYTGGKTLTYSLNAHSPYEGWRIAINGSKGRLEAEEPESGLLAQTLVNRIRFFDMKNCITTYEVPVYREAHGGGDNKLRRMLFAGDIADPLGHQATSVDGAVSMLIGAAANVSIAEKRIVNIGQLIGDATLLQTAPAE